MSEATNFKPKTTFGNYPLLGTGKTRDVVMLRNISQFKGKEDTEAAKGLLGGGRPGIKRARGGKSRRPPPPRLYSISNC